MLTSLQRYPYSNSVPQSEVLAIDINRQLGTKHQTWLRIPKPIGNTIIDITPSVFLEHFCILRCGRFSWNGIRSLIMVAKNTNKYFRRIPFNFYVFPTHHSSDRCAVTCVFFSLLLLLLFLMNWWERIFFTFNFHHFIFTPFFHRKL